MRLLENAGLERKTLGNTLSQEEICIVGKEGKHWEEISWRRGIWLYYSLQNQQ